MADGRCFATLVDQSTGFFGHFIFFLTQRLHKNIKRLFHKQIIATVTAQTDHRHTHKPSNPRTIKQINLKHTVNIAMANKDWSKLKYTEDMVDYMYEKYKNTWKPGDDATDEMLDDLWNYAMVEG